MHLNYISPTWRIYSWLINKATSLFQRNGPSNPWISNHRVRPAAFYCIECIYMLWKHHKNAWDERPHNKHPASHPRSTFQPNHRCDRRQANFLIPNAAGNWEIRERESEPLWSLPLAHISRATPRRWLRNTHAHNGHVSFRGRAWCWSPPRITFFLFLPQTARHKYKAVAFIAPAPYIQISN
jgi:hypothetical protein